MKLFIIALATATLISGWADGSSASEHKGYTQAQCEAATGHHWRNGYSYNRTLKSGEVREISVRGHCRKPSAAAAEKQFQAYLARSPEGESKDGKVSD